jgi:hypothetical protein
MNRMLRIIAVVVLFAVTCAISSGQDKRPADEKKEAPRRVFGPVRVQVVLTEFDGDKKVATLPYVFAMDAEWEGGSGSPSYSNFLRLGVRVPIPVDKDGKLQYLDLGSNIDCGVSRDDEGHYLVRLNFERSSMAPSPRPEDKNASATSQPNTSPLVPTFRSQSLAVLKDSQPSDVMVAADPLTGHVYHLNVTVTAQK